MTATTRSVYRPPWRIDLTVRAGVPRLVPLVRLVWTAADALDAAGAPRPASIGLILADDLELAALNAAHLGHEGPTDVLSFPLLEPSTYPAHQGQAPAARVEGRPFGLPPGRRTHLGDVVVSVERAIAQAEAGRGGQTGDVRWSAADELWLLVTHGVLHVCGWDHALHPEEVGMRALEQRLMAAAR